VGELFSCPRDILEGTVVIGTFILQYDEVLDALIERKFIMWKDL
jgi:hypothetical protein